QTQTGELGAYTTFRTEDAGEQSLALLTSVKNLFVRQLPYMPREYITRLVFDRNHHSVVCVKNRVQVVAGITMRVFLETGLGEIAFCAVDANEQVRGYGTRIMNHAKEYARSIGLHFFLTYADNQAIEYFRKQGFSDVITVPKERWKDRIKDYRGSTPMEFIIRPNTPYLNLSDVISTQKLKLMEKAQQFTNGANFYSTPKRGQIWKEMIL
ncbi:MAG: putative Histone acetyltransferase GCN5, partial [Streblomastix strix]